MLENVHGEKLWVSENMYQSPEIINEMVEIYIRTILGYFTISQSSHYNIMMVSICRDLYCIRLSPILGLEQCVHILFNRASG